MNCFPIYGTRCPYSFLTWVRRGNETPNAPRSLKTRRVILGSYTALDAGACLFVSARCYRRFYTLPLTACSSRDFDGVSF